MQDSRQGKAEKFTRGDGLSRRSLDLIDPMPDTIFRLLDDSRIQGKWTASIRAGMGSQSLEIAAIAVDGRAKVTAMCRVGSRFSRDGLDGWIAVDAHGSPGTIFRRRSAIEA